MKPTSILFALIMSAPLVLGAANAASLPAVKNSPPEFTQIAEKAPSKAEAAKLKRQAESNLREAAKRLENNKRFREAVKAKDERSVVNMLRKESGHTGELNVVFNGGGGSGPGEITWRIKCTITYPPFGISCDINVSI